MRLKSTEKTVNTKPIEVLLRQGEKSADCIEIESDKLYGEIDLSLLHWTVYGVTASGNLISQSLKPEILDTKILLKWKVSEDFTAEAGLLYLQFMGVDEDDNTVVKWHSSNPINVLSDIIGNSENPPNTNSIIDALIEMRAILEKAANIAVKTPYIGNLGTWMVWDIKSETYKDTGIEASGSGSALEGNKTTTFLADGTILETVESTEILIEFLPTGDIKEMKKDKVTGEILSSKTTQFLSDGSISEVIE